MRIVNVKTLNCFTSDLHPKTRHFKVSVQHFIDKTVYNRPHKHQFETTKNVEQTTIIAKPLNSKTFQCCPSSLAQLFSVTNSESCLIICVKCRSKLMFSLRISVPLCTYKTTVSVFSSAFNYAYVAINIVVTSKSTHCNNLGLSIATSNANETV